MISQYSNCKDAISLLQEDLPDVVLMDIGLPGMSGIEGTTFVNLERAEMFVSGSRKKEVMFRSPVVSE